MPNRITVNQKKVAIMLKNVLKVDSIRKLRKKTGFSQVELSKVRAVAEYLDYIKYPLRLGKAQNNPSLTEKGRSFLEEKGEEIE